MDVVGEYLYGMIGIFVPQCDPAVVISQYKSKNQGKIALVSLHNMRASFQEGSISFYLMFINKKGLSFSFYV